MVLLSLEVLLVLLVLGVGQEFLILCPPEGLQVGMVQTVVVGLLPNLPQFVLIAVSLVEIVLLVRVQLPPPALDKEDILGLLVLVVHSSDLH